MKLKTLPALGVGAIILFAANAHADPYSDALAQVIDLSAVEREATPQSYRSTQELAEAAPCELKKTVKTFKPGGDLNSVSITTYLLSRTDADSIAAQDWPGIRLKPREGERFYVFEALGGGSDREIGFDNILVDDANKAALVETLKTLVETCS